MCACEYVSECTRNVLLCENGFFVAGVTHSRILKERNKKNVHMNFCASTQRRTLLFMLFSTIYVEGVSFLLTNIYILVRMLCACMCVQREQGESCFIWLCGQVSASASARRARSLFFFFNIFPLCTLCQRHQATALLYIFPCFKLRLRFFTLGSVLFFVCVCSSLPSSLYIFLFYAHTH